MAKWILMSTMLCLMTGCQYIWPFKAMSGPKAAVNKETRVETPAKQSTRKIKIRIGVRRKGQPTTQPMWIQEINNE